MAVFDPDTLPLAIGISTAGLTLADGDTTVDAWAATYGALRSGVSLAAPASTNRPAYSASGGAGGRPLVTFDGVDDVLTDTITKGSAWDDYEIGVVCQMTAAGATLDTVLRYGSSVLFLINERAGGLYRFTVAGGGNLNHTTAPSAALAHFSGDAADGTGNARVAGAVEATASITVTSRADGDSVSLGAAHDGSAAAAVSVVAWYIGEALTDEQRTNLRAWLTAQTGVAS